MELSQSIIKLSESLCKAQKEFKTAIKNRSNPYFRSKYADYTEVLGCVKPALNKYGISIIQPINNDVVETVLLHESGEYIKSSTKIYCTTNKPQDYGSAITYARRYALSSLLSIDSDEDDDGNVANGNNQPPTPSKPTVDPTKERLYKLNGIISKLLTSGRTTTEELEKYLEFPLTDISKHITQAESKIKKLIEGMKK